MLSPASSPPQVSRSPPHPPRSKHFRERQQKEAASNRSATHDTTTATTSSTSPTGPTSTVGAGNSSSTAIEPLSPPRAAKIADTDPPEPQSQSQSQSQPPAIKGPPTSPWDPRLRPWEVREANKASTTATAAAAQHRKRPRPSLQRMEPFKRRATGSVPSSGQLNGPVDWEAGE